MKRYGPTVYELKHDAFMNSPTLQLAARLNFNKPSSVMYTALTCIKLQIMQPAVSYVSHFTLSLILHHDVFSLS